MENRDGQYAYYDRVDDSDLLVVARAHAALRNDATLHRARSQLVAARAMTTLANDMGAMRRRPGYIFSCAGPSKSRSSNDSSSFGWV